MITVETKNDDGTVKITCQSVETPEHVHKLIEEFELDHELRSKNLLGLDGNSGISFKWDFSSNL